MRLLQSIRDWFERTFPIMDDDYDTLPEWVNDQPGEQVVAPFKDTFYTSNPAKTRKPGWSVQRSRNIAASYRFGNTMQQIADDYDLSKERVRQILHGANVKIRPRGTKVKWK